MYSQIIHYYYRSFPQFRCHLFLHKVQEVLSIYRFSHCFHPDYFLRAYCPNHCYHTFSIKWLYIVDFFSIHTSIFTLIIPSNTPISSKKKRFLGAILLIFYQYSIRCFFVLSLSAWLLRMFFFTVSFCLCRNLHIALSLNLTPVFSCQSSQYSEACVIWMFCYHLFEMFFLTKELARFSPFCLTRE